MPPDCVECDRLLRTFCACALSHYILLVSPVNARVFFLFNFAVHTSPLWIMSQIPNLPHPTARARHAQLNVRILFPRASRQWAEMRRSGKNISPNPTSNKLFTRNDLASKVSNGDYQRFGTCVLSRRFGPAINVQGLSELILLLN